MVGPTTISADITAPTKSVTFLVPGDRTWLVRSVFALVNKANSGGAERAYTATVQTSTGVVAAVGAPDAGTEPGQCEITWADVSGSTSAVANFGVVVAPMHLPPLAPGYTITLAVIGGAAGDSFASAIVWYDYVPTGEL